MTECEGNPGLAFFYCGCNQSNLSTRTDKGSKILITEQKKQLFYAAFNSCYRQKPDQLQPGMDSIFLSALDRKGSSATF